MLLTALKIGNLIIISVFQSNRTLGVVWCTLCRSRRGGGRAAQIHLRVICPRTFRSLIVVSLQSERCRHSV